MAKRDRAAYMREYRARQRANYEPGPGATLRTVHAQLHDAIEQRDAAVAEVVRLKRELAQRSSSRDPFREFRPAPKPGKGSSSRPS